MKKAHLPRITPRLALLLVLLVALFTIPLAINAEVGNIPESFPTTRWEDQEGIAGKTFEMRSAADRMTSYEYYDHYTDQRETVTINEAEYLGSRENPIAIDTVEDLILFGQMNAEFDHSYYILTAAEYDLDGHTMLPMTPAARDTSNMSDASRFHGTLIGNGAVIRNAWIIGSADTTVGVDAHVQPALFTAAGGSIVDLTLENIRVAGGVGRMGILYADTAGEDSTPRVANVKILGGELYPDGDITSITTLPDTAVNSTAEITLCTSFTPKENMGLCHTTLTVKEGCTLTVEEGRQVLISPTVTGNVVGNTHTHNENGKSYQYLWNYGIHEEAAACENCPIGYVGEYREAACSFDDNGICPCGEYQEPPMLESVYRISNAGQLLWYAENGFDTSAILTADIVVNKTVLDENNRLIGNPDDLIKWTPFRLEENQYLDGNGNTISGLYAKGYYASFISGISEGATLKNLRIENSYFDGTEVGGLVCKAEGGRIENCSFSGLLAASRSYGCVGGLVGTVEWSENGTALVNCLSTATFEVEEAPQGALIGCVDGTAPFTVTNCYYKAEGSIPGVGEADTEGNVGTPVTAAQLASGEITHKLNGERDEGIWKQTLHGADAQPYPNFEGLTVHARRDGIHLCNTAFTDATATVYTNDDREAGEGRLTHLAEEDDGDCTTAVLCQYCSFVITKAQEHAYDALCTDTACNNPECEAIRPLVHTVDTAVWHHDASSHWHECPCGEVTANAEAAHTWRDGELTKAPTCQEPGERAIVCTVCGATSVKEIAIDATAHEYGGFTWQNETHHKKVCECGATVTATHLDENGDRCCDLCGEPIAGGGLTGGAIAGIAVGATAVVGLGGFSLFWFVLKKKSWQDLIALFKK